MEELENENEKLQRESQILYEQKSDLEKHSKKKTEQMEQEVALLKQEIKDMESKQMLEIKAIKERFETEKELQKTEIQRLAGELIHNKSFSPLTQEY